MCKVEDLFDDVTDRDREVFDAAVKCERSKHAPFCYAFDLGHQAAMDKLNADDVLEGFLFDKDPSLHSELSEMFFNGYSAE